VGRALTRPVVSRFWEKVVRQARSRRGKANSFGRNSKHVTYATLGQSARPVPKSSPEVLSVHFAKPHSEANIRMDVVSDHVA